MVKDDYMCPTRTLEGICTLDLSPEGALLTILSHQSVFLAQTHAVILYNCLLAV